MTPAGLISHKSAYDAKQTTDRFVAALKERGVSIFARIDQVPLVRSVGLDLRHTEVFLIGNPRAGGPLMRDIQTTGIDLPLRALIWEDEAGSIWLSYNDPALISERFQPSEASRKILAAVGGVVAEVAQKVTGDGA